MSRTTIDEFMIGTSRQLTTAWSARVYARYRNGSHFWEDTNNTARQASLRRHLGTVRDPKRSTSTTWRRSDADRRPLERLVLRHRRSRRRVHQVLRGDARDRVARHARRSCAARTPGATTTATSTRTTRRHANDAAVFIGSSNIGDGAGRQLWDYRYGDLRGDRRTCSRSTATYSCRGTRTAGALVIAQSGQPWEAWSFEPVQRADDVSTSDTIRFAEPAGSRRVADA